MVIKRLFILSIDKIKQIPKTLFLSSSPFIHSFSLTERQSSPNTHTHTLTHIWRYPEIPSRFSLCVSSMQTENYLYIYFIFISHFPHSHTATTTKSQSILRFYRLKVQTLSAHTNRTPCHTIGAIATPPPSKKLLESPKAVPTCSQLITCSCSTHNLKL